MLYRYFFYFWHGILVFANFSCGIVVSGIPQCVPPIHGTMSNFLSSTFQNSFPSLLFLSMVLRSAIVACSPLLGNIFNEQHCNLVNIVFMVAKFHAKLCLESRNVFDLRQKHF